MSFGDFRSARPWPAIAVPNLDGVAIERALLALTAAAAVALLWLAPRLPMSDLPQHAAQVALWRDLLLGRSAWADLVRINLVTPYLIGYGVALPLAFVMPIEAAMRVTLSLGLLGFLGAFVALRRRFGGDPRLDWLVPVGCFGFAWQWGFFTFLVAAPLALVFLLAVEHARDKPGVLPGARIVAAGCLLLAAHGLLFVAFLPVGGAMALWAARRDGVAGIARGCTPFVLLAALCLVFRLVTAQAEGAMRFDGVLFGDAIWLKPLALMLFVTNADLAPARIELPLTLLLLLVPVLLRCRLNAGPALVPFAAFLVVVLAMPSYAFQTALLFHRFALFLLPFYALMFRAPEAPTAGPRGWAVVLPMLACWYVLGTQADRIRAFADEARPFETVLAAAEPGKRALSLVFDRGSPAAANSTAYLHFPLWYQAEKGGFVDFNFADFHPQIVRFRAERRPDIDSGIGWHPDRYDDRPELAANYDYLFVRGTKADVAHLIDVSACTLTVRAAAAEWTLLERAACLRPPLAP